MKVSIIGGGNIAHSLSVFLGNNPDNECVVLTNNYANWSLSINEDNINSPVKNGKIVASNDYKRYIPLSDIIIITVPAFAKEDILKKIQPFFNKNSWIGAFPGGPHFDLLVKKYLGDDTKFFATQRVPFISRIREYGKSVSTYPKEQIHVAFSKEHDVLSLEEWMETNLHLKVVQLKSFLQITISNSNPILHPARLYSLFKDYKEGYFYNKMFLFYEEWDDLASQLLINMDEELHEILRILDIKGLSLNTIKNHYGVDGVKSMTKKIVSIDSFKGIEAPMKKLGEGFIPDFESRYFTEDFSFGLLILRDFADLISYKTPVIDTIINWVAKFILIKESTNILKLSEFNIKSVKELHDEYR